MADGIEGGIFGGASEGRTRLIRMWQLDCLRNSTVMWYATSKIERSTWNVTQSCFRPAKSCQAYLPEVDPRSAVESVNLFGDLRV